MRGLSWFSSGNILNPTGGQVLLDIAWPATGIAPINVFVSVTLALSIDIQHTAPDLTVLHTQNISIILGILNIFPLLFPSVQLTEGDRLRIINNNLALGNVSAGFHIL